MGKPYNLFTKEEIDKIAGSDVSQGNVQPNNAVVSPVSEAPKAVAQPEVAPAASQVQSKPVVESQPAVQRRPIRSTEELAAAMGYTSPEEEERLRKASVTNQRIMAVADALRHIGNIANTVDYSPSQQFNQPWAEERARYERGKALRDAANYKYMSYEQAKAAQEQKMRQADAQLKYKMDKDAADAKALQAYRDAKLKAEQERAQNRLDYYKERDEANREQRQKQNDIRNAQTQERINIAASKASGGGRRRSSGGRKGGSGGRGGTGGRNKLVTKVTDGNGRVVRTYTQYGDYKPNVSGRGKVQTKNRL